MGTGFPEGAGMQDAGARQHRQTDGLDPARANALQIALGQPGALTAGDAMPVFFHHLYFWDPQPPQELGRDGHPKVGGFIPDFGLPRRMWAGGQLEFHHALRLGTPAEKVTQVHKAQRKQGRSGALAFVTLRHDVFQDGQLCVTEFQDLVYRSEPDDQTAPVIPPMARSDAAESVTQSFDSTLLFRYSALTMNGHRIHYDLDYAKQVEGYDGLVVHGPLLAQMLMSWADRINCVKRFEFRATAPLMHFEDATLCRNGQDMWVQGPDGRQCMTARFD